MKMETLYKTRRDLAKRSIDELTSTKNYYEEVIPIIISLCKMETNLNLQDELMKAINIGLDTLLDNYKSDFKLYNDLVDIDAK